MSGKLIRIEKLNDIEDAYFYNNIEVGYVRDGHFISNPEVGKYFYVGFHWRTSMVKEIINSSMFKTQNSIYRWNFVDQIERDSKIKEILKGE